MGKFGGMEGKVVEACCVRRGRSESASWREDLAAGRMCKRAYCRVLLLMQHMSRRQRKGMKSGMARRRSGKGRRTSE